MRTGAAVSGPWRPSGCPHFPTAPVANPPQRLGALARGTARPGGPVRRSTAGTERGKTRKEQGKERKKRKEMEGKGGVGKEGRQAGERGGEGCPPALRHSPVPRADDADTEPRHAAGCAALPPELCRLGSGELSPARPPASTAPPARSLPEPPALARGGPGGSTNPLRLRLRRGGVSLFLGLRFE